MTQMTRELMDFGLAARECLHGVTMSIDVTAAVDAEQLVDAVRRADHAMYQAKRSGKDNVTRAEVAGYVL